MHEIENLARFAVLRASEFAGLAILMIMMGTAHDPAASMRFGAAGFLIVSCAMTIAALVYHRKPRIQETEVWIMLAPENRPAPDIARRLIINAMRSQLLEKALWGALAALFLILVSAAIVLTTHGTV